MSTAESYDDIRVIHEQPTLAWWPAVEVDGMRYLRATVRTDWIRPGDDLAAVLTESLQHAMRPGDFAIVSEKAVIISAGLGVPVGDMVVSPFARRLAGWVRPTEGSRGLSIPEKMEYVVRDIGRLRLLTAMLVAGLTRPLGLRGGFYVVAGRRARAMDGMRPPFEDLLLPPLPPRVALELARGMADRLRAPVAIVDMNDRGGSIRAISHPVVSKRRLCRILADNPLQQRDARTPIGLVRPDGITGPGERG